MARLRVRGIRVLTVTGLEAEVDAPYAGLHRLLRRELDGDGSAAARAVVLAAGLTDRGGPAAQDGSIVPQPYRVGQAALELLTLSAADEPLLIVVDDAQWLDELSWEALAFVGRRLEEDAVLLLLGLRDGPESERRLRTSGLPELRLGPLADADATIVNPSLDVAVIPVTAVIIVLLFAVQRRGTAAVGRSSGR